MTGTLYTQTTWIEAVTKVGPTNMAKIEQALADGTRLFSGLYSALPAASAAYVNKLYYATDKLALFACFDGAAWTQLSGAPVTTTMPANSTFSNHYINYTAGWGFTYWKDPDGIVHVVGEINDDGTGLAPLAANTIIWGGATGGFPAGFRPVRRMYFSAEGNAGSSNNTNHFLFNTSGEIRISDNGPNVTRYTNFGHITFPTY